MGNVNNSVLHEASMNSIILDNKNNDQIAPLIVGGTPAVSGEFRGKVGVLLDYAKRTHSFQLNFRFLYNTRTELLFVVVR